MSIYFDKLAHVQVVINWYFIAQLCTREDGLAYILGAPSIEDYNVIQCVQVYLYYHANRLTNI